MVGKILGEVDIGCVALVFNGSEGKKRDWAARCADLPAGFVGDLLCVEKLLTRESELAVAGEREENERAAK